MVLRVVQRLTFDVARAFHLAVTRLVFRVAQDEGDEVCIRLERIEARFLLVDTIVTGIRRIIETTVLARCR